MPVATEWLLSFSNFLQNYGWIVLVAVAVAFVLVRIKLQTDAGKDLADRAKLKIPVLGDILMNLAVARFCRVLGTLLGNGVPILKSLEISGTAAGNRLLQRSVTDATENIKSGESLATPLRASGHFPPSVVEMISVGEESNSLDTVLPDIADSLEKTTFRRLDLFVRSARTDHVAGDGNPGSRRRSGAARAGAQEQHHAVSRSLDPVKRTLIEKTVAGLCEAIRWPRHAVQSPRHRVLLAVREVGGQGRQDRVSCGNARLE